MGLQLHGKTDFSCTLCLFTQVTVRIVVYGHMRHFNTALVFCVYSHLQLHTGSIVVKLTTLYNSATSNAIYTLYTLCAIFKNIQNIHIQYIIPPE